MPGSRAVTTHLDMSAVSASWGSTILRPPSSRRRQQVFQETHTRVRETKPNQKKLRTLLVAWAIPDLVPPHMPRKYNIDEMSMLFVTTSRPAKFNRWEDQ
jgi:hypothetical protein